MRDHARLRATLRAALLVAPLLGGGGGCGGKTAPARDDLVGNSPADGGVAMSMPDAAPLPVGMGNCERGQWCGPPEMVEQAAGEEAAAERAGSCRTYFQRDRVSFNYDKEETDRRTAAGDNTCCYVWSGSCPRPVG